MIRAAVENSFRAGVILLLLTLPGRSAEGEPVNDYPTNAKAEYVFGCMAANGQSRDMLERCSCSIDILASIMPYDRSLQAETILSMRQGVGERTSMFRNTKMFDDIVAELRRAQAEAEIRCFR